MTKATKGRVFAAMTIFVLTVAAVCFGFWLGGYDFDERGKTAVEVYFLSMVLGGGFAFFAAICPYFDEGER